MLTRLLNEPVAAFDHVWSRPITRALLLLSMFALYLLSAGVGRLMPRTPDVAVTFWLPAGVFVAALVLTPLRAWPVIVAVQCLSELAANAIWFHNPVQYALLYFVGNALAALFAATMMRLATHEAIDFKTPRQILVFVVLGACGGPLWSAGVIAAVDSFRQRHEFMDAFAATWVGDATGMLVMAPLLVIGAHAWRSRKRVTMERSLEAAVVSVLLVGIAYLAFMQILATLYLALPVLIWASMRFKLPGAAGGLALVTLTGALAVTFHHKAGGPDGQPTHLQAMYVWTFYGIAGASSLLVAAMARERESALQSVQDANAQLESRVAERTAKMARVTSALERERERLGIALRAGHLGVYEWNVTANTVTWSPETFLIFGVDPLQYKPTVEAFEALVHPDDRAELWRKTRESVETRTYFHHEYRIRRPDGEERWVVNQSQVSVNDAGEMVVTGVAVDITERRKTEAAIRSSEEKFRALANAMPQLVWVMRSDGTVAYVNERARAYDGLSASDESPLWRPCIHPDDAEQTTRAWQSGDQGWYECKHRLRMADGEYRWHICRAIRANSGDAEMWYGTSSDVHDLVLAQEAAQRFTSTLAESEERFRVMADGLSLLVWVHGADAALEFVNETYCEFYAVTREEMRGGRWRALTHPDDGEAYANAFLDAMRNQTAFHARTRVKRADGAWRWVESWGRPRFAANGAFLGMVGASADVTERVIAEQELTRHREQLEQLVTARTAELEESYRRLRLAERMASLGTLSAGLGHDMANILVPMRMSVQNLQEASLPAPVREDVELLSRTSEYLKSLTAGLRMLSLDPESVSVTRSTDLAAWWKEAEPICRTVLPRGVIIEPCDFSGMPEVALTPHAMTQIVFNLVQNAGDALRERAAGRVWLSVRAAGEGVELTVRDDGPGMTDAVRERCLEPFFTTKARARGTGLGLAIVHQLLERFGGRISVQSEPDRGAAFILWLPAARQDAHAAVTAMVTLHDPRFSAIARGLLTARGAGVVDEHASLREPAVWITDANVDMERIGEFLSRDERRWVVHVGGRGHAHPRAVTVMEPRVAQFSDALAKLWKTMGERS
ncbi:MAG TPA: PAS domain-containing protein [Phycisphaerales bacterium]|nr:PAS domain-containing protein [Phycisphaerales bacterium]